MRTPNIAQAIADYYNASDGEREQLPLSKRAGLDPSSREGQLTDLLGKIMMDEATRKQRKNRDLLGGLYNILKNPRYSHRGGGA